MSYDEINSNDDCSFSCVIDSKQYYAYKYSGGLILSGNKINFKKITKKDTNINPISDETSMSFFVKHGITTNKM